MTDGDELYEQALRHVTGDGARRDWRTVRALLRQAFDLRQPEALLRYPALVALGAAARPDWAAACALLRESATTGAATARCVRLLDAMALTADGRPTTVSPVEPLSLRPRLALARALLTPAECAHVRDVAAPRLTPSMVADPATGVLRPHPVRTSEGAVLGPLQYDLVLHALNERIAAVTGTQVEQGEPLSVLRYRPGQQYRMHHDCLPGEANQRFMTVIVYLNDGFDGGGTAFEALGQSFRPDMGDALIFLNIGADGRADPISTHAGEAVTAGEKWVATRWIRQRVFDPWGLYG